MRPPSLTHSHAAIFLGDCLDVLAEMPDDSIDSIVTDPPYGLGFMGKAWDDLPPGLPWAQECLRVLKPGGHLLAFGGTRTWHRLAVAVEDAGFEVRDSIAWLYGSGFPKSLDVSKAIDKAARGVPQGGSDPTSPNHGNYRTTTTEGKRWNGDKGQSYGAGGSRFLTNTASARTTALSTSITTGQTAAAADGSPSPTPAATAPTDPAAQQWVGWGTALKPAFEPIVVARKPLVGTVAANVLAHGTGALNIDATRVGDSGGGTQCSNRDNAGVCKGHPAANGSLGGGVMRHAAESSSGRWPANVLLDGSQAEALDADTSDLKGDGADARERGEWQPYADSGGASRFFPTFRYQAKAPTRERPTVTAEDGTKTAHPTVKPLALMRWLVRLVTPPGGTVLDTFAGSGATIEAAIEEGFYVMGIEREADYLPLIQIRLDRAVSPVTDEDTP